MTAISFLQRTREEQGYSPAVQNTSCNFQSSIFSFLKKLRLSNQRVHDQRKRYINNPVLINASGPVQSLMVIKRTFQIMFLPVLHLDICVLTLGQTGACQLLKTFKEWVQVLWEALKDAQTDN